MRRISNHLISVGPADLSQEAVNSFRNCNRLLKVWPVTRTRNGRAARAPETRKDSGCEQLAGHERIISAADNEHRDIDHAWHQARVVPAAPGLERS